MHQTIIIRIYDKNIEKDTLNTNIIIQKGSEIDNKRRKEKGMEEFR